MTDETERPEDTVRRFAQQIGELLSWQQKYREAAELWDALDIENDDQVLEAVLIAKLGNFEKGRVEISISASDSIDWIGQLGLLEAARVMSYQKPIIGSDDDE